MSTFLRAVAKALAALAGLFFALAVLATGITGAFTGSSLPNTGLDLSSVRHAVFLLLLLGCLGAVGSAVIAKKSQDL